MGKKKKEPVVSKMKRRCFVCDGSGQKCNICGESEAVCGCDELDMDDCGDCYGTGIASADIEESDLKGDKVCIAKWKKDREEKK